MPLQPPPVRTLLADAHHLTRAALRLLLEQSALIEVVAETDDGLTVPNLVVESEAALAIIDRDLPNVKGLDLLPLLRQRFPGLRLLLLSHDANGISVAKVQRAGADGLLDTHLPLQALAPLLQQVMSGGASAAPGAPPASTQGTDDVALPDRQRQLLDLLGRGYSMREIANLLGISIKTAETHRARLMQALRLRHSNDLIRFAVQREVQRPI